MNRTIELSGDDSGNEDAMEVNQEDVVSLASGEEADVFNEDGTVDTVWKWFNDGNVDTVVIYKYLTKSELSKVKIVFGSDLMMEM